MCLPVKNESPQQLLDEAIRTQKKLPKTLDTRRKVLGATACFFCPATCPMGTLLYSCYWCACFCCGSCCEGFTQQPEYDPSHFPYKKRDLCCVLLYPLTCCYACGWDKPAPGDEFDDVPCYECLPPREDLFLTAEERQLPERIRKLEELVLKPQKIS